MQLKMRNMMQPSPTCIHRSTFLGVLVLAWFAFVPGAGPNANAQTAQLACSPCSVNFGNVAVGGSESVPVTISNPGSSALTITGKSKTGPWYFTYRGLTLPYQLAAGQSVTFNMTYTPQTAQTSSAAFSFTNSASGTPLTIATSGTGVAQSQPVALQPSSLAFNRVPVGGSSTQSVTVSNPGSNSVTLTQIASSSNVFSISGAPAPITLSAHQSYTFQVAFAPTGSGDFYGNLSVTNSSGGSVTLAENGVGIAGGVLSVSPTSLNFGNVVVGQSSSQTLTLSANSGSVTITSDSLGSTEYSISGVALPLVLTQGKSAPVIVTFTPKATGAAPSTLAFSGQYAKNDSVSAALNGSGITTTQHSVALAWQPSTSTVTGYNVYRKAQSDTTYAKINSSQDASTGFADASVQAGITYNYEVTSLDSSGVESVPSSPVQATIPTP
jgi:hypothetical protein